MKTPIQKLHNSRLFYNKWPYKIECTIFGAHLCSFNSMSHLKTWCLDPNKKTFRYFFGHGYSNIDKVEFLKFLESIEPFMGRDDIKIRTENNHFNIFCYDKSIVEDIEIKLRKWVRAIYGPTTQEELEHLIANGNKQILCDKLPKDNFKYKIHFRTDYPLALRSNFLEWASKFEDKIIISPCSKKWLEGSRLWNQDPFAYIKDGKTLTIVALQASNYIKRTEEYILRSDILM